MNALEMTDNELYKMGLKVLTDKLGASEVPRFIRQCKPGKGNYSVDRHKLADQPDIDTIVKRIQNRRIAREAEERARAERFAAPQSEIRKMTDVEIYEIGNQVLVDKLGVGGLMRFIGQCQELNGGYTRGLIKNTAEAKEYIKLYTASLTFNPKIVEDYISRGNAYSYIGEHDKAIADYNEAIRLKPNYAKAYYNRGNAYRDKVNFDKAIADYTKVIELNADYVDAYYNRGKLYAGADAYDEAIADFSMTIKFRPNDVEIYYDRGTAYGKKGEFRKAIRDFNNVIKRDPTFTQVYFKRGLLYAGISEFPNAIKDYDKVLEFEPRFGPAYAIRGIIRLHLKEWKNAKLDLDTAKKLKVDISNIFRQTYKNVADFEQRNDIQLPKDIAAMLRRQ